MPKAIINTSPFLYLYRIGHIEILPRLLNEILTVPAVVKELNQGREKGYRVPSLEEYTWLQIVAPNQVPSEWLAADLGRGELETMSLALEHRENIVVLDDALARRIAKAAGLEVWGTLRVLLEGKKRGFVSSMASVIEELSNSGMWISTDIRRRILKLAGEER